MGFRSTRWVTRAIVGALFTGGLLAVMSSLPVTAADESTRISFLGLDQGDATLVEVPGGQTLLFGGGTRAEGPRVVKWLRSRGVRTVDAVLVQTWKESHFGGLASVFNALPVRQFLYNPIEVDTAQSKALKTQAAGLEAKKRILMGGAIPNHRQVLSYSPLCQLTVLGPTGNMQRRFRKDPSCSLMLEVTQGKDGFLNLGDADNLHQRALWSEVDEPWGQLLRIGQNGVAGSLGDATLKRSKTRVAVIPVARKSARKPAAETLSALRRAGVRVYRTDLLGTVTVTMDGSNISVKSSGARP